MLASGQSGQFDPSAREACSNIDRGQQVLVRLDRGEAAATGENERRLCVAFYFQLCQRKVAQEGEWM